MSRANWKSGIPKHLNKTRHPEVPQDTSHTWHLFVTGTVWFQVIQACKADEDLQFWPYLLRMVKDANKLSQQAPKAYTKKTLAPPKQVVKHIQMVFVYCDDTSKPQTCPHNKQQFQRRQIAQTCQVDWSPNPSGRTWLPDFLSSQGPGVRKNGGKS